MGLIITEGTTIGHKAANGYPHVPRFFGEDALAGWKQVVDAVHAEGGRIVPQLWHVGSVRRLGTEPDASVPGYGPMEKVKDGQVVVHGMTRDDIQEVVAAFAQAARDAKAIGMDGVEIHGAHGYLIDQFLKTGANQRKDDYGGSIENRARLLLEVTRAIVEEIGGGRTGIRLSPVTPANDIVDADPQPLFDYVVRQLGPLGLAYVHVIEGATGGPRELPDRPFDYAALKAAYRHAGGQGAWMVNNAYTRELADAALANGADIVAFGRPFIANPDLVERLRRNAPLNEVNRATLYGGGAEGYTDYPALP